MICLCEDTITCNSKRQKITYEDNHEHAHFKTVKLFYAYFRKSQNEDSVTIPNKKFRG